MPDAVDIEVIGLKETQKHMDEIARNVNGAPMVNAIRDATLLVTGDARRIAPVDTGRLRASIMPEVRTMSNEVIGVVGSNVHYAPYMELGTRPHWPPSGALAVWARRHGVSEFVIRRAIAVRGTKARRFLQGAFEKNKAAIIRRIEQAIGNIVS